MKYWYNIINNIWNIFVDKFHGINNLFYDKQKILTATCPAQVKNLLTSSKQAIAHCLWENNKFSNCFQRWNSESSEQQKTSDSDCLA